MEAMNWELVNNPLPREDWDPNGIPLVWDQEPQWELQTTDEEDGLDGEGREKRKKEVKEVGIFAMAKQMAAHIDSGAIVQELVDAETRYE